MCMHVCGERLYLLACILVDPFQCFAYAPPAISNLRTHSVPAMKNLSFKTYMRKQISAALQHSVWSAENQNAWLRMLTFRGASQYRRIRRFCAALCQSLNVAGSCCKARNHDFVKIRGLYGDVWCACPCRSMLVICVLHTHVQEMWSLRCQVLFHICLDVYVLEVFLSFFWCFHSLGSLRLLWTIFMGRHCHMLVWRSPTAHDTKQEAESIWLWSYYAPGPIQLIWLVWTQWRRRRASCSLMCHATGPPREPKAALRWSLFVRV